MKYQIRLNGNLYEVEVEKGQAEAVYIGAAENVVASAPVVENVAVEKALSNVKVEGNAIKAPMPGKIVDVRISANQQVKAGDILFILEAMKMENEIVAPSDGTVTSVSVNKGANVEKDQVLAGLR